MIKDHQGNELENEGLYCITTNDGKTYLGKYCQESNAFQTKSKIDINNVSRIEKISITVYQSQDASRFEW